MLQFVSWIEKNGPFGVIIDAANVAFYGQNFESGGFSFHQIECVLVLRKRCFSLDKSIFILTLYFEDKFAFIAEPSGTESRKSSQISSLL